MRRLIAKTVFSGLVMLCRLAVWPTRTSPLSVKATIDGVVRAPSAFSITLGVLPSITATQELVVPRSIPIALAMTNLLFSACCGPAPATIECASHPLRPARHHQSFGRGRGTRSVREERPEHVPRAAGSGGFLDFDLFGFAARRFRDGDFQHAVRHGGLNLRWIDPWRQLKHSIEHAVASFSEMVVLVLIVLLAFDLLLAADGQHVVLDRNLNVFAFEPRHFRRDHDLLLGLRHVDAGNKVDLGLASRVDPARKIFEQAIDFAMQEAERIAGRVGPGPTVPGGNERS